LEGGLFLNPLKLFWIFFRVSALTIGGGYAMIPVIKEFIVDKFKVLEEKEFMDVIVTAQTVPGVIAINTAMIMGHKLSGIKGAFFSVLGCVIPPFSIILTIAFFFSNIASFELFEGFFSGARVGVTVILAKLSFDLVKKNVSHPLYLIIIAISAGIIFFTSISAVVVLLSSCVVIYFIVKGEKSK
jgi:chromate transporter